MTSPISHITFIVKDIERSARLFQALLGATEVYDSGGRNHSLSDERFLTIGPLWIALMKGEPLRERTYNHIAFRIAPARKEASLRILSELGLEVLPGRSRIPGEGESIYFHDFDGHLFELHTGTIEERLASYARRPEEGV
ncbi:MAG TPA: FosX/FosE/FosI family fosfomycin resistance hydrolase [Candidatus Ozemobacteraceae bacterium]